MGFSAIVVAAGSGSRAGGDKQWRLLGGKPVVRWSVEALLNAGADEVIVVSPEGGEAQVLKALPGLHGWRTVAGGRERSDSVRAGLAAVSCDAGQPVLIHDAARPLLDRIVIERLLTALASGAVGAIPVLSVSDSLKRGASGVAQEAVPRDDLWRAQTPQAFRRGDLERAYAAWPTGAVATDDAAVMQAAGGQVRMVEGDARLMKLTFPEDFAMAEALIAQDRPMLETRIGQGFDAHRWGPGETVWLCGVPISHDQTLVGHSDADAGLHALTDAILGALGEGDIGDHFPPTDPQWKGASSDRFLTHAVELVRARGGRLINVDVTLICERPRIKPHRQAMRERLATLLALSLDAVSVKATTTEGMGFTGRGEGLAAQAVVSIGLPASDR